MPPSCRRNLEIKARCVDLATARAAAHRLGAGDGGIENQVDTYFHVAHGRLKLREINGREATLIWYERPNHEAARESSYHLVPVADAALLKAALSAALGVRGAVRKRREILLWHNVRIHLDDVASLGTFLEFEAVLSETDDEAASLQRLETLSQALAVSAADHLAPSYADLLGL